MGIIWRLFIVFVAIALTAVVSYGAALEGDPLTLAIGQRTYFAMPYQFTMDQEANMFGGRVSVLTHVGSRPVRLGKDGILIYLYDKTGGDGNPAWRMYKPLSK